MEEVSPRVVLAHYFLFSLLLIIFILCHDSDGTCVFIFLQHVIRNEILLQGGQCSEFIAEDGNIGDGCPVRQ